MINLGLYCRLLEHDKNRVPLGYRTTELPLQHIDQSDLLLSTISHKTES